MHVWEKSIAYNLYGPTRWGERIYVDFWWCQLRLEFPLIYMSQCGSKNMSLGFHEPTWWCGWPWQISHVWASLQKYISPYTILVNFRSIMVLSKRGIKWNNYLHQMSFPKWNLDLVSNFNNLRWVSNYKREVDGWRASMSSYKVHYQRVGYFFQGITGWDKLLYWECVWSDFTKEELWFSLVEAPSTSGKVSKVNKDEDNFSLVGNVEKE